MTWVLVQQNLLSKLTRLTSLSCLTSYRRRIQNDTYRAADIDRDSNRLKTRVGGIWLSGIALVSINEVNLHRARLILGWVTVSGFNSRCRTFISVCNQPPKSTQSGHPFVSRRNEYQPKGGDALRLGSKSRYGWCVGGR